MQSNSVFQSRVPNCKDMKIENAELPGPGTYDLASDRPAKVNDASIIHQYTRMNKIYEDNLTQKGNYL